MIPLIRGEGLAWDLTAVQENFPTYAGYILFGAGSALFYEWFGGLGRLLFGDIATGIEQEGVGTQGLRILGRTVTGGLIGGLLFSVVMWQIDFLPNVARLVGASSEVAGFFIHMGISQLVGASYGLLFTPELWIRLRTGLGDVVRFLLDDLGTADSRANLFGVHTSVDFRGHGPGFSEFDRSPDL